jgi:hypothetical protein
MQQWRRQRRRRRQVLRGICENQSPREAFARVVIVFSMVSICFWIHESIGGRPYLRESSVLLPASDCCCDGADFAHGCHHARLRVCVCDRLYFQITLHFCLMARWLMQFFPTGSLEIGRNLISGFGVGKNCAFRRLIRILQSIIIMISPLRHYRPIQLNNTSW